MGNLTTYSPSDVIVSIAGLHTVTGYPDGVFVKIQKDTKPFEKTRAMNGEISRIYSQDDGFRLELTLMQSSPSNNVLSVLYNVDLATRIGKFPVIIKDSKGQTNFISLTTWIEQLPDVTFSNGMELRTWVFGCADATIFVGGNDSTSAVDDAIMLGSEALPLIKQFM